MFKTTYIFIIAAIAICSSLKAQVLQPPIITHLSLDSISGQVEISWANASPQTEGYIVYKRDYFGLWSWRHGSFDRKNTARHGIQECKECGRNW